MTWHVDTGLLHLYARGQVDDARASSVEAHLLTCETCRSELSAIVPAVPLDRIWLEVVDSVEAPRRGSFERFLARVGVPDHVARLLAATPSLRLSWLAAVGVALGFAVLATRAARGAGSFQPDQLLPFLVVAPLVPLAGVAVAYGPGVDPTYEVGLAAPMRTDRLLLIRTLAVVGTSVVLASLAALGLPGSGWTAAWLLPSLALCTASLALSTSIAPALAFGPMAALWIAGVLVAEGLSHESLPLFGASAQLVFAATIVVAGVVLAARRQSFEIRRHG
jgi:anti-sigma factor RsiW